MKRSVLFLYCFLSLNCLGLREITNGPLSLNFPPIDTTVLDFSSFYPTGFSNIPKYARFEIGVKLPGYVQQQVDSFSNGFSGLNPYNPDHVQVRCEYVHAKTGKSYLRNGFYYQDFKVQNNLWIAQNTPYNYRLRFAPPLGGLYHCKLTLALNGVLTLYHAEFDITVSDSENPGNLVVAEGNLRKLNFENGHNFFGVGEDIAYADQDMGASNPNFTNPPLYYPDAMSSPNTHSIQRGYLKNLADNEGNFARVRLDPWSVPIVSADKTLSDPYSQQNMLYALNNYNHNQMFMWEMDSTLALCENRGIYLMLNIMLEDNIQEAYSGDDTWKKNPYNAILSNDLPGLKAFFKDSTAKVHFKRQLYYLQARWGYSTSIGIWELINETQAIGEYRLNPNDASTGQQPYVLDLDFRKTVNEWICEMKYYLESNFYPWHPITCGFQGDLFKDGKVTLSTIDTEPTCLNVYLENQYSSFISDKGKYTDSNKDRSSLAKKYFDRFRPFIFGEVGMPDRMNQVDMLSDREYHNTVWATSMSGCFSCALHWHDWREQFNVPHRANFKALRKFFDNVVELKTNLEPYFTTDDDQLFNPGVTKTIDNFYMLSDNRQYGVGWAQSNSSNWTLDWASFPESGPVNIKDSVQKVSKFDGKIEEYDCHSTIQDPSIVLHGLLKHKRYKVRIFDSYDNAKKLDEFTERTNFNGKLSFKRFMPKNNENPFYPDYAYTLEYIHWIDISLYPNPTNDKAFLQYDAQDFENLSFKVIDVLGRIIPVIIENNTIYTDVLPEGIYFLIVKSEEEEGGIKFVVKH